MNRAERRELLTDGTVAYAEGGMWQVARHLARHATATDQPAGTDLPPADDTPTAPREVEWTPEPGDVPRFRREMIEWLGTDWAAQMNVHWAAEGRGVVLDSDPVLAAAAAVRGERQRLAAADLFYVSPDMVDLVLAAYADMPEFAPRPEHLPTPAGFIVFGKPLTSRPLFMDEVDYAQRLLGSDAARRMKAMPHETPVVAAAWGPFDGGSPRRRAAWTAGGLFINFYSPSGIALMGLNEDTARRARGLLGPISNENEAAFALQPDPDRTPPGFTAEDYVLQEDSPNDHSAGTTPDGRRVGGQTGPWARMLLATFIMMMQPGLAEETTERTPRQQRRRDERAGLTAGDTRIVHLRRSHPEPPPAGADTERATAYREWHHKWVVRGHWRQQAYGPGRAYRRPKWIAPHLKGPEDKPLIGGDKVNVWDRA